MANLSSSNIDPSLVGPIKIVDGDNPVDAVIPSGNVGIGVQPTEKLSVQGVIESKTGGIKFPDATVQTTAASGGGASSQVRVIKFIDSNGTEHTTQEFIDNWINPTKVSDNAMAEGRNVVSWSLNDDYLAVGGAGVPNLRIYKKTGINTFIELSNMPAGMSDTNNTKGLAWDPTGTYLAVASDSLPNLRIYKRVGDSFTELTSIDVQPTPNALCISWSSDGVLAVGGGFLEVWTRSGDNFTKQADPTPALGDPADDIEWDPTGEFLSVAISASNAFSTMEIYQKTGVSTLTRLPTPTGVIIGPGQRGLTTTWSPNGLYVAFGTRNGGSNGIRIFKRSGTTFTNITANLNTLPTSDTNGLAFSPDGKQFAYANNTVPYVTIFDIVSDIFTKTSDLPAVTANGFGGNVKAEIAWGNSGKYFVNTNTTGFSIYSSAFELSLPAQTEITDVLDLGQIETNTEKVVDVSITKFTDSNGVSHSTQTLITPWENSVHVLDTTITSPQGVTFDPSGTYLAVDGNSTSKPFLRIYKRSGDLISEITVLPTSMTTNGESHSSSWSADGAYLIVCGNVAPFYRLYKRSGDTFTESFAIPLAVLNVHSADFSVDDVLIITSDNPIKTMYQFKRDGDVFTAQTNHEPIGGGVASSVKWSNDGKWLALARDKIFGSNEPVLQVYQKTGVDTLTLYWETSATTHPTPGIHPGNRSLAWSPDGNFIVITIYNTTGNLSGLLFERTGSTFTEINANVEGSMFFNSARGEGPAWTSDGKHFGITTGHVANRIAIYTLSGTNTFTLDAPLPNLTDANTGELTWTQDGKYLVRGHDTGFQLYKTGSSISLPAKTNVLAINDLGQIETNTEKVVDVSITKFTDSNGVSHSTQTLITPWKNPIKLFDFEILYDRDQAEWSPSGTYLALGGINQGGTPFISIWKKSNDTLTEITALPGSMLAVGRTVDLSWSADGAYLMAASNIPPYFLWYKRSGDTFTELPTPSLPAFTSLTLVDESIDGLVMLGSGNPVKILYLFKRVGDTLTQQANPDYTVHAGQQPEEAEWSHNGEFIAVSVRINPVVPIYQKTSGDTVTKLLVISLPTGTEALSFAWSFDDKYLLVGLSGNSSTQRILLLERSGTTFTDVTSLMDVFPDSSNFPTGARAGGCAWSPDGKTFAFSFEGGINSYTYTWNGSNFIQDIALPGIIGGTAWGQFGWSPSGVYLIKTSDAGTSFYKTSSTISLPAKTNVLAISDLGTIPSVELEKRIATATDITTSGRGIYAVTDTSIARSITLSTQDSLFEGNLITIKDESGLASVNNITILTEGAETIDGLASVLISTNFGSIKLYSNGIDWFIF